MDLKHLYSTKEKLCSMTHRWIKMWMTTILYRDHFTKTPSGWVLVVQVVFPIKKEFTLELNQQWKIKRLEVLTERQLYAKHCYSPVWPDRSTRQMGLVSQHQHNPHGVRRGKKSCQSERCTVKCKQCVILNGSNSNVPNMIMFWICVITNPDHSLSHYCTVSCHQYINQKCRKVVPMTPELRGVTDNHNSRAEALSCCSCCCTAEVLPSQIIFGQPQTPAAGSTIKHWYRELKVEV